MRKSRKFLNGVIEDKRIDEEKRNDYKAEEIATFPLIKWEEVPQERWRQYPIFFQDGSGSCVAQATSKALGIENYLEEGKFVHFSARDIYTRRSNSGMGMWLQDALDIGRKFGATIEQLMPSQGLNEDQMNDKSDRTPLTEQIALPGRGGNYVSISPDIDKFASVIEPKGKPVVLLVHFTLREWNKAVPTIIDQNTDCAHGVVATQSFLYKGEKAILIEDSWGSVGFNGRRVLTKNWFNGRIYAAGYFEELKNTGAITEKPKCQFKNELFYGMTNNNDVKMLTHCLNYLRMFPDRPIYTGNFYGMTLQAVKLFQATYGLLQSGRVDQSTINKLNLIFK